MTEASKKRSRDDIPCVPIGSPVWIVKSWREVAKVPWNNDGISEYCVHGVFATLKAANAEARRARDRLVEKYDEEHMYELQEEEEEGTDEDERADEEVKKVKDKDPFVYCRDLGWDGEDGDEGDLNVVVEKVNVQ